MQQPRHPRLHHPGRRPDRLEAEVACPARPGRCGRASSTASAWPPTPAATAAAATRSAASSSSTSTAASRPSRPATRSAIHHADDQDRRRRRHGVEIRHRPQRRADRQHRPGQAVRRRRRRQARRQWRQRLPLWRQRQRQADRRCGSRRSVGRLGCRHLHLQVDQGDDGLGRRPRHDLRLLDAAEGQDRPLRHRCQHHEGWKPGVLVHRHEGVRRQGRASCATRRRRATPTSMAT